jgi:hypothetical protein
MLWVCLLLQQLAFYSWSLLVFVEWVGHSYRVLAALLLWHPRVPDSRSVLSFSTGIFPSSDYLEI